MSSIENSRTKDEFVWATSSGLGQVVALWWKQRVQIVLLALAGFAVALGLVVLAMVLRPVRQQASLGFRLSFPGVEKGQYPNGASFTPADMVATPVLQEVYDRNGLEAFIDFEDFKDACAVTDTSPATERLRRAYQSRLQDRRLTPLDRQKMENEFEERVSAMRNGDYTLLLEVGSTFRRWPATLVGKVMDDVLAVWAEQSRGRGVFRFNINFLSDNILSELDIEVDDYPLLLDRLRLAIGRMLANLRDLSTAPGARLVRTGENKISLSEVELLLVDDLRYRLSLMEASVYSLGLTRDRLISEAYIREQILRLDRDQQKLQTQLLDLESVLENYSASRLGGRTRLVGLGDSPVSGLQGGDSFLDRVLDLSTRRADVSFRQNIIRDMLRLERHLTGLVDERQIYERMHRATVAGAADAQAQREEFGISLREQIDLMMASMRKSIGHMRLLHAEISQRNLQPSTVYMTIDPAEQWVYSSISMRAVALSVGFIWVAYLVAALSVMTWRGVDRGRFSAP